MFNALDTLVVTVHSVKMPVVFGRCALKSGGRPIPVMAHLKRSIVEVKAEQNCLAHALVIAIAKVDNNPNYKAHRQGRKIRPGVQTLVETIGIDLSKVAGIPELVKSQEYFREYKIIVYHGLNCEDITFEGQVDSVKRINLLYDEVERHYHVSTNLTGAMARRFVCKACNKSCARDVTHACDRTCSDCMPCPRAHSLMFAIPARNAIGTLEVTHVSPTTNRAPRRKNHFVNEGGVVRSADGS